MKVLSNNSVTRDDLNEVDVKQTRQIYQLRIMLGVSAAINLLVAIGGYFFWPLRYNWQHEITAQ